MFIVHPSSLCLTSLHALHWVPGSNEGTETFTEPLRWSSIMANHFTWRILSITLCHKGNVTLTSSSSWCCVVWPLSGCLLWAGSLQCYCLWSESDHWSNLSGDTLRLEPGSCQFWWWWCLSLPVTCHATLTVTLISWFTLRCDDTCG